MLANTIRIFLSISGALLIALNLILIRAQRQADWQRPLLVMGLLCLVPYFFERRRLRDFVLFAVPVIALYFVYTRDWPGALCCLIATAALFATAKRERETEPPMIWRVSRQVVLILGLTAMAFVLGAFAFRSVVWFFEGLLR